MLIEASKGGHAAVVNLLLDFTGHPTQGLSDDLNQSQFSLDFQQASQTVILNEYIGTRIVRQLCCVV
jgi:hypothetical protein